MASLQPQFGIRDYLSYLVPGVVALFSYVVWNPSVVDAFKANPIASSIGVLVGGYLIGHICKGLGDILLSPLRRYLGFNPYANALNERSPWGSAFRESLQSKLEEVWGKEIIEQEINTKPSNVILLCWYDTFRTPSRGHDEVDRYISLFNLCLSLIPACSILMVVCLIHAQWLLLATVVIAIFTFARYWYKYEWAFCYNILRIWYIQANTQKDSDDVSNKAA